MINIRYNIFETNSSSTHGFAIDFIWNCPKLETIVPDKDAAIVLTGGDFTKEEYVLRTPLQKANLIATVLMTKYDPDRFMLFENLIKEHTGAESIIYDIHLSANGDKDANTFCSSQIARQDVYWYDGNTDEDMETDLWNLMANKEYLKLFIFGGSTFECGEVAC